MYVWYAASQSKGSRVLGTLSARKVEERKEKMENRSSARHTEERSDSVNRPRRRGRGLIIQGLLYLVLAVITAFLAVGSPLSLLLPLILGTAGLVALLLGIIRRYSGPEM